MMPKIAEGDANKVWIVPSEIGRALEGLGSTMSELAGIPQEVDGPRTRVDMGPSEPEVAAAGRRAELASTNAGVEEAIAAAERAADPRPPPPGPPTPGPTTPTDGRPTPGQPPAT